MEFQSGHPVLAGFLSEVMGSSDSGNTSSFTQYIILATICGRCICHMQQSTVERLYGQVFGDFWQRHQWLDAILTQQTQVLSLQYLLPSEQVDPMLLFTNMISHAAFLYLTKIIESVSPETGEHQSTILEYEKRSLLAAQEIVHLARALSQVSCFKAGPSRPLHVSLATYRVQGSPFHTDSTFPVRRIFYDARGSRQTLWTTAPRDFRSAQGSEKRQPSCGGLFTSIRIGRSR